MDGHKWEFDQEKNPYFTSKTRVIKKSQFYGSPPLVASSYLQPDLKKSIQDVILNMHNTAEGKTILNNLIIDRFEPPKTQWYEKVQSMYSAVHSKSQEGVR